MSKAAQLKRKAAEFEQKRQYDRALATYLQAVEGAAEPVTEADIPIYNRIGDLYLRQGEPERAVRFYEKAADLYAAGGFFNNAIALCNKVLRHAPDRSSVYHKLGRISAEKGFHSDAKKNFLEYAARMERAGKTDEAFRALEEFADLCPGQEDVRLMLADQLARVGRTDDAIAQLQLVHEALLGEDRDAEAQATLERIRALDPAFEPRQAGTRRQARRDGLVFIDVEPEPDVGADVADHGLVDPVAATSHDNPAAVDGFEATVQGFEATSLEPDAGASPAPRAESRAEEPAAPAEEPAPAPHESTAPPEAARSRAMPSWLDDVPELPGGLAGLPGQPPASDSAVAGLTALPDPPAALADRAPADPGPAMLGLEPTALSGDVMPPPVTTEGELSGAGLVFDDVPVAPPPPVPEPPARIGPAAVPASSRPDDQYVDLEQWLRETEPVRNPRMTAHAEEPEPGAMQTDTDFANTLETFKRGVAQHVDETDADSQYDLGVAYMEMGLVDEAISQFQKALRANPSPEGRVRAYEALGRCFLDRGDDAVALSALNAALVEPGLSDVSLIGVLYLLGEASERLGHRREAEGFYRRVFGVDIHFRDVGERLRQVASTR